MKLQAGKPKAVARCDWCNRGLFGQMQQSAKTFLLVNHVIDLGDITPQAPKMNDEVNWWTGAYVPVWNSVCTRISSVWSPTASLSVVTFKFLVTTRIVNIFILVDWFFFCCNVVLENKFTTSTFTRLGTSIMAATVNLLGPHGFGFFFYIVLGTCTASFGLCATLTITLRSL